MVYNNDADQANNNFLDTKFVSEIINEVGDALASFTEEEPAEDWFFKDSSGGWKDWHTAT